MTLKEITESAADFLTPEQVAEVLGCKPYAINAQAKEDARRLGFPVCMMGTRVRIPRLGFLHWLRFGNAPLIMDPESARREFERLRDKYIRELQ